MKKHSIVPDRIHTSGTRITTLAFAHFIADMMGGTLPGILPVALVYFHLNLGLGVIILTSMSIGSNLMQIPASLLDRAERSPRTLYVGLAMAGMIVLLALFPPETPLFLLCILMVIVGAGIAIMHPLGLRGVQQIGNLAPTVTTPTFMTGGFLGASMGPWISAVLVENFGLNGLYFLLIPVVLLILSIRFSNVKLAKDLPRKEKPEAHPLKSEMFVPWSFASLLVIGLFMNMGTTTVQALIPSYLVELGFQLQFGGLTAMLFGIGSSIGSIGIGFLVRKRSCVPFVLSGFTLGIPLLILYFRIAHFHISCLLMFAAGLLMSSIFPLLVSLARNAESRFGMSARMGLIVGGTWGLAGIVLLPLGQLATRYGLGNAMQLSWGFYICALVTAVLTLKRRRPETK